MPDNIMMNCECYSKKLNKCSKTFNGKCIENQCQVYRLLHTLFSIKAYCLSKKEAENVNSLYDAKMSGLYLASRVILLIIDYQLKENK